MLKTNDQAIPVLPENSRKLRCANSECNNIMIASTDQSADLKSLSIFCSPSCCFQCHELKHGSMHIDVHSKGLRTLGRRGSGLIENNWYKDLNERIVVTRNEDADGGKRKVSIVPIAGTEAVTAATMSSD